MLLPSQLLKKLNTLPGFDEESFIFAHTKPPVTSIRLHPLKQGTNFLEEAPVYWCSEGRYLPERPQFIMDPDYHAGAYYVQEASSMFTGYLFKQCFEDRTNLRVLDLCASPGGKSTAIASLLTDDSLLITNDVIRARATILHENITRWGYSNTWVTSNDAAIFGKLEGYFDCIMVDAPCSGSGLFRKEPWVATEWNLEQVDMCAARQKRILADVWPALKTNGILIYATCSYSPEENEDIIDWLSAEYSAETVKINIPDEWGIVENDSLNHNRVYRFFPDKVMGEGLFMTAVRKTQDIKDFEYPNYRSINEKAIGQRTAHFTNIKQACCLRISEGFSNINPLHEQDYHALKNLFYFRRTGLPLGEPKRKEWLPAHDIALSTDLNKSLPSVILNKEQCLRFLKREEVDYNLSKPGWYIVQYEKNALSLGFIKWLGSRANNYLPKNWRIRIDL